MKRKSRTFLGWRPGPASGDFNVDSIADSDRKQRRKRIHPVPSNKTGALEELDDPHRLARLYVARCATHRDGRIVHYYREQFWRWDGKKWKAIAESDLKGRLANFCKAQLDTDSNLQGVPVPKVTTALIANVRQALIGDVHLGADIAMPSWLGDGTRSFLAMENGLLDIDAYLSGSGTVLLPHTPRWFSPVLLPYAYDASANCPKLEKFLWRNLDGDLEKIRLLQQFAGYLLTPDVSLQRYLMLLGEGANGKSVFCAVLIALLGKLNTCSVPLELFGDKFHLTETLGRLANIVAEFGELDRIAEGKLKAYVTGDPMLFERKFKEPFTAVPSARLVIASNNGPQFRDKSDGIWRRILLVNFNIQIPEAERIAGMDSPAYWTDELPGVLNWALLGLGELRRQGRFIEPAACKAAVDQLRTDSNPARRFLTEHYQAGPGEIPCAGIYREYANWCSDNGHRQLAETSFGKEVIRQFPTIRKAKKGPRGRRENVYEGLQYESVSLVA